MEYGMGCNLELRKHLYLAKLNYPHNCYTLDLTNHAEVRGKGLERLLIYLNELENTVTVHVEGFTMSCSALIPENDFYSESIKMEKGKRFDYAIKIEKNVYMEDDPTKNCRNYPNTEFRSYCHCWDQVWKKAYASVIPGLMPVWMAEDMKDVTTKAVFFTSGSGKSQGKPNLG
jgi:hypothetical protein